jgi:hypothetical protein
MAIEYDSDRSDYTQALAVFVDTKTEEYMKKRHVDRDSAFYSYSICSKDGAGIVGFEGQLYTAKFRKDDPESAALIQFIVLEAWDIARSVPYTKDRFKITDADPLFKYITKFLYGERDSSTKRFKNSAEFEVIFDPNGKKTVGEIKRRG